MIEHDMSRSIRIFALAGLAAGAAYTQAFAHAHLSTSAPAAKSSVASPSELDLTFTEGLNLKFSGIKVAGPGDKEVKLGDAMLMNDDKVLMVPVSGKLEPGAYKVEWHVLSIDGHKMNGSFGFTVKP
jgi:methionine-rich copper-binding protein CopC